MMTALDLAEFDRLTGGRMGVVDVPCPACGPDRRSPANQSRETLRVWRTAPAFATFNCARCKIHGHARDGAVRPPERFRLDAIRAEVAARDRASEAERIGLALRKWAEAVDPAGTVGETYLAARGLRAGDAACHALRFHPRLRYDHAWKPGLIALFRHVVTDQPVAIHRIFVDHDGRKLGRRMYGPTKDAAVKLTPDEEVTGGLTVCEGIETGLAILDAGWRPIWALGSAGAIERLPILPGIDALSIFADADDAGMAAARACGRRWADAGRGAQIFKPPTAGADWNDICVRAA